VFGLAPPCGARLKLVGVGNEKFDLSFFDAPLPTRADSNSEKFAGSEEGVNFVNRNTQDFGNIFGAEESSRMDFGHVTKIGRMQLRSAEQSISVDNNSFSQIGAGNMTAFTPI
jgi:hypothetical protein